MCCSVLQHVSVRCSALQCAAVCCSAQKCTADLHRIGHNANFMIPVLYHMHIICTLVKAHVDNKT